MSDTGLHDGKLKYLNLLDELVSDSALHDGQFTRALQILIIVLLYPLDFIASRKLYFIDKRT
jgi:hypothetical protein